MDKHGAAVDPQAELSTPAVFVGAPFVPTPESTHTATDKQVSTRACRQGAGTFGDAIGLEAASVSHS